MNFFLKKQLIKEGYAIFRPRMPICPENFFFGTNHYYYFYLPIGLFHYNSYSRSRVMMHYFWAPNGPFAPNNFFSGKSIIPLASTY